MFYAEKGLDIFCQPTLRMTKMTQKLPKVAPDYECIICDYYTSKTSSYTKHLLTAKHIKMTSADADCDNSYQCNCGKEYKQRQGLWRHKQVCHTNSLSRTTAVPESSETPQPALPKPEATDTPQTIFPKQEEMMALMFELVKQNSEFKDLLIEQNKQMMELANKAGNNNCNNTNSNNKFNLNVFLNETCKDAITMDDFINSIQVTREDFIHTGEFGFIEGISTTLMKNFRNMDLHTRPLHCTDLKRETVYIKNADKWEKDDADKTHLRKAVRGVAKKNMSELWRWYNDSKPEVEQIGTDVCEKYFAYHKAALGGYGKEEDLKFEDKIIKNVLKDNQIDKNICVNGEPTITL